LHDARGGEDSLHPLTERDDTFYARVLRVNRDNAGAAGGVGFFDAYVFLCCLLREVY
jgi:hypothetical protein